ncbi:MAG: OmpA family protein [Ignavibacteria bacterium]|nr:OmpA family protein [Ignavibacteria bacterium]
MAVNLLELTKSAITPEIISKLSGLLGENSSNTQSAIKLTLPAIIGILVNKSSSDEGASEILKLIKDNGFGGNLLSNLDTSLMDKNKFFSIINSATGTLSSLFGEKLKETTNLISKDSGVSSNSSSSLLGFLAAIVMSLIGKQITGNGMNSNSLSGLLSGQKSYLAGLIPSGLAGILGLAGLNKISANIKEYKDKSTEAEKSGFKKLLPWLLIGLGAILLFFLWKSCNKETVSVKPKVDSVKAEVKKRIEQTYIAAPKTGDALMDSLTGTRKFITKALPDGTEIIIAENGAEAQLLKFIEDKNISAVDSWISFDRILFETDKATLRPSSEYQGKNVVAILKAYPDVNLKIGGYTDNTGIPQANLKLSQARADAVMNALIKNGIDATRLKAEGFGEQFPVASNDTPEGRERNRRVDVRISKK